MKNNLLILFFIILFLRVVLFILPSFQIDMSDWQAWSYRLTTIGFQNFYSQNYFSDYFPGYLYILWLVGNFYHFVFSNLSFANFRFEVLIKLVTTIFDLGTAFYIYKIVNNYSPKFAHLSALLYLINPAVIFNTSVWGQIDGIFTFFLIYSSYLLTETKRPLLSGFSSGLSILLKPHALAFLPVMLSYYLKFFRKQLPKILIIIFFTPIILSIPFFINDPFFGLFNLAQRSVNVYPFSSLFAFNFWGIFNWSPWQPDNKTIVFSYKTWGVILYGISLLIILIPLIKHKFSHLKFYLGTSISFFSFYLFLTRMHERYLFPFLAFILIASLIRKSKKLLGIYLLISLVHFINLWYVYYYYNFVYNNPIEINNSIFNFIGDNHSVFSLITIISFLFLLIFYLSDEKISK